MKKKILAVTAAAVMLAFGGCAGYEDGVGEDSGGSESAETSGVIGGGSEDDEVMRLAESMAESMFESRLESMEEGLTETDAESTAVTAVKMTETPAESMTETAEDSKSISCTFYRKSEDESRILTIDSDIYPYDCEEMTVRVDSDGQRFLEAEGYEYIDLENLKNYPNLKRLIIGDSNGVGGGGDVKIINGGSAAGLENLEAVELFNSVWWEEDWLSGIDSLRKLSIQNCWEYDGVFLENLKQVEYLDIHGCAVTELSFLNGMNSLTELSLERLDLSNSSFDGLEDNYTVKRLNFVDNSEYIYLGDDKGEWAMTEISGLSKFKRMEYLYLWETHLADGEKKLEELRVKLPACEINGGSNK